MMICVVCFFLDNNCWAKKKSFFFLFRPISFFEWNERVLKFNILPSCWSFRSTPTHFLLLFVILDPYLLPPHTLFSSLQYVPHYIDLWLKSNKNLKAWLADWLGSREHKRGMRETFYFEELCREQPPPSSLYLSNSCSPRWFFPHTTTHGMVL